MKDNYGRPTTSIRISVTNDCDLNCFYCHREGCIKGNRSMTPNEIGKLIEIASKFGVDKVKLTGGEPMIRPDIISIVQELNKFNLKDLSMTTNGVKLAEKASELRRAGLNRINISLDTLDPEVYEEITGHSKLNQVLKGIDAAIDEDLWPVKLNMLLLKGVNDDEVEELMEYSINKGTILQIIELLFTRDIADIYGEYHESLDFIEEKLKGKADYVETRWLMQARKKYLINNGQIEIVNPMHNSEFCNYCTRIRATPDGYLKPCLMRNDNLVDILKPIRSGKDELIQEAFREAINRREPYCKSDDRD